MKKLLKHVLGILVILCIVNADAYELKSRTTSSVIVIKEVTENNFEIVYCRQGEKECVHLGSKPIYSFEELKSLRTRENINTGLSGAGSVAVILAGAFVGGLGGGFYSFFTFASSDALLFYGMAGGAIISAGGISLIDRMNPSNYYKVAKAISKAKSDQVDFVNDIDSQALWLNSRLNLIK